MGKYDSENIFGYQHLCIDLFEAVFELKENNVKEVYLETEIINEELKIIYDLVESIVKSQNIILKLNNI